MRILARQLTTVNEIALEAEVERKVGWMLKAFYVASATFVGYQFFPYMGDNFLHQPISLMHVKDPLFKRMGASRISRFAVDGINNPMHYTIRILEHAKTFEKGRKTIGRSRSCE
ncbi:hypothetical protein MKX03_008109 [Papaver bracteatum]|nr:hypothetical protein MKX03_008109 [Papaver bracteatum]